MQSSVVLTLGRSQGFFNFFNHVTQLLQFVAHRLYNSSNATVVVHAEQK